MAATSATVLKPGKTPSYWLLAFLFIVAAIVVVHAHAVIRHGTDAEAVRKCLENKGPHQLWRSNDGITFYRLCELEDGRWGLQAILKDGNIWHEKTAFIRGDGSWKALMEYLQRLATRFNGPLP